ncbi:gluconolactonase [Spirosoma radiotolerans]|uniref:Gluconolactonase n=1 Tax=Spirosoma radiotolerans TaxID=1379870 RepID=A0A0E3VAX7_9BACT|nr:gluconolactonase [Spirosoma radiotolerans]
MTVTVANRSVEDELFKARVFTSVNSFTSGVEGPAVDKAGMLYAVNFERQGTIGQITPDGQASLFVTLPEGSIGNGIRFNQQGDMFIADYPKHNILRVANGAKQVTIFASEPRMNQPNDIAIDNKDRLYASDPNWKANTGNLWRIDPDGKVTLLEENMGTSNGVEVSPDSKILYVNESVQRKVWAYELSPAGTIRNKRLLIEFGDFGMDGMRCDIAGNLYIARHGKGTVVKVSPAGKILQEIVLTGKKPSNITFGGKDNRTAYVTLQDQGNLETFRIDTPGRR